MLLYWDGTHKAPKKGPEVVPEWIPGRISSKVPEVQTAQDRSGLVLSDLDLTSAHYYSPLKMKFYQKCLVV